MYVNREKGQEKFESFQLLEDEMVRRKGIFDINQGIAVAAFCDGPTPKEHMVRRRSAAVFLA